MRASLSRTWARIAPVPILTIMLLTLWALLALSAGSAAGQSKSTGTTTPSDTTSDGGFNVRVKEEGGPPPTAADRERIRRKVERIEKEAEASRAHGQGLPDAPEPPEPPDLELKYDNSDNNLVRFGEDITIPEGKVIDGDVVAIGGSVTVLGRVKGDCVSVGGAVIVKGKGVVEGDAVSMGGGVTTSDSGSVAGSNVSLGSMRNGSNCRFWPMVGIFGAVGTGVWLLTTLIKLLLTLFFAWLALLLIRERMLYAVERMTEHFGKSFLWGLLGWAGMVIAVPTGIVVLILVSVIAIAILAITIIGIPLAILLVIALILGIVGICVGSLVAIFIGFLNGAMFLGRRILAKNAALMQKPLLAITVGLALIFVLNFVGELLKVVGLLVFHPISIALGIASGALAAIVTTSGFGAMILTRFAPGPRGAGSGGSQWWPPSKPTPAPTPEAPSPETAPPVSGGSSDAP